MSLVINNNMMAANTARNLTDSYGRLATSVQRLSTGLRINSAADDAAGLAIRETMRAEVAALKQGVRNAQDGISMIQTAEGALAVIDEKLIRMKELAEQAATGTYTNQQRLIIHSEFAAMAAEIDRIAESTEFNGIKLLNGNVHAAGYDGTWSADGNWTANAVLGDETSGTYSNNSGWIESNGAEATADDSTNGVIAGDITGGIKIHFGTSNNRAEDYYFVRIGDARTASLFGYGTEEAGDVEGDDEVDGDGEAAAKTPEDIDATRLAAIIADSDIDDTFLTLNAAAQFNTDISAIGAGSVLAEGSVLGTGTAFELSDGDSIDINGYTITYREDWNNSAADSSDHGGGDSNVGFWVEDSEGDGAFVAFHTTGATGTSASLAGLSFDSSDGSITTTAAFTLTESLDYDDIETLANGSTLAVGSTLTMTGLTIVSGRSINAYIGAAPDTPDVPTAPEGQPSLLTQHQAQQALTQIDTAIIRKENIRANLGALQNRLENTITNLSIQAENLQSAESRISDVDIASEMTEFVRNQVLTSAAVAMLGQANSLPQMALRLLG